MTLSINTKIILTIILFIIGGFYIHYSFSSGLISIELHKLDANADYIEPPSYGGDSGGSSGGK